MEIGERYRLKPAFMSDRVDGGNIMIGTIVRIPGHRRFAEVEFPGGVRECFSPGELTGENLVRGRRRRSD